MMIQVRIVYDGAGGRYGQLLHFYSTIKPVAQMVKSLPAKRETWVPSLGGEDPLEEGMATHSSILAWRIPRTEEPGGLQSMRPKRVGHH